jgi:short-subunit dehydrogenase
LPAIAAAEQLSTARRKPRCRRFGGCASLAKSGVSVLTIKPGFVDTPMTAAIANKGARAQPDRVAAGIVQAIDGGRNIVYLPWFWRWIMLVIRHIPEPLFKRLKL